jgi:hypothetical protein
VCSHLCTTVATRSTLGNAAWATFRKCPLSRRVASLAVISMERIPPVPLRGLATSLMVTLVGLSISVYANAAVGAPRQIQLAVKGSFAGTRSSANIYSRPHGEIATYSYGGLLRIEVGRQQAMARFPLRTVVTVSVPAPLQILEATSTVAPRGQVGKHEWIWSAPEANKGWVVLRPQIFVLPVLHGRARPFTACFSVTVEAAGVRAETKRGCVVGRP